MREAAISAAAFILIVIWMWDVFLRAPKSP